MNVCRRSIQKPVHRYARSSSSTIAGGPLPIRLGDTQDIYVNDLDATLEAHRATNRARLVRRVEADTDPGVKRITIERSDVAVDELKAPTRTSHAVAPTFVATDESTLGTQGNDFVTVDTANAPQGLKEHIPRVDSPPKPWHFWPVGSIQHSNLYQGKDKARKDSVQEYRPRAFAPDGKWRLDTKAKGHHAMRPWLRHLHLSEGDASQRLGNEIKAYEKYMALSYDELYATRRVALDVKSLVLTTLNEASCDVIGSYSTGLALPFSDIDIAVSLPAVEAEVVAHSKSPRGLEFQKIYRNALYKVQKAFSSDPKFFKAELVFARIPIVRVIHRKTNQEIQVQIKAGNNSQQQHTLAYLAEYSSLRPLYTVLRLCLEMRGLAVPYEGGLGSYPILISIVNALKHASGQHDPHDLGGQLLHVLKFYETNNLYRYGFSVDPPRLFRKDRKTMAAEERLTRATDPVLSGIDSMDKLRPLRPYLLCLQDPADPKNDLGRKAYAIKHIQRTFAAARQTILEAMEVWDRNPNKSFTSVGLLDALVHANYRHFQNNRTKLERFQFPTLANRRTVTAREMLEKVTQVDQRKAAERNINSIRILVRKFMVKAQ
ncbi:MAG: hypothetical protein Q9213_004875 [Squamulea squamosa]